MWNYYVELPKENPVETRHYRQDFPLEGDGMGFIVVDGDIYVYVQMYICVDLHIYICICIHIYIYIHTYIYTYTRMPALQGGLHE